MFNGLTAQPNRWTKNVLNAKANSFYFTTNAGKKMKKCSTAGWDSKNRVATGCTYIQWLKASDYPKTANESTGEEFLPPEAQGES